MPTYVYGPASGAPEASGCAYCRATFEVVQRMADEALKSCPRCAGPVERRLQMVMLGNLDNKLKGPSESAMEQAGFTQYKKSGTGTYEKSFGKGPSLLNSG